jgi:tetracycline repressor-like protein
VVEHHQRTVLRPGLLQVLEAAGSARDNLDHMFQIWEQVSCAPDFNGCLMGNCIAEMSAREPDLAHLPGPKLVMMEGWLRQSLEGAQRAGELDVKLDVNAVARAILALLRASPSWHESIATRASCAAS